MKRLPVVLLCGFLLCCGYGEAYAQQTDPRTNAKFHLGPFYVTPSITIRDLGIDSNVLNAAGNPESDFTYTLEPKVDIWLPFRRLRFQLQTTPSYVYFHSHPDQRSLNPNYLTRLEVPARRVTFFGQYAWGTTRDRINREIDERARRATESTDAGVVLQLSPKVNLDFAVSHSELRYDVSALYLGTFLSLTLNRESDGFRGAVNVRLTPLTTFAVRAESSRDRFVFSSVRDSNQHRVMAGFRFAPRAIISGQGFVGARKLDALDDRMPDSSGVVASAQLTFRGIPETAITFRADHDLGYSFSHLDPYYILDGYGLSVRRRIIGSLDAGVGGSIERFHYKRLDSPLTPPSAIERRETVQNLSTSMGYRLDRRVRVEGTLAYWKRVAGRSAEAGLPERGFDGFRFTSAIVYDIGGQ